MKTDEERGIRRQWRLYQYLISSSEGETLAQLAARYEVDERTIKRDLATLCAVGLNVIESTEKFGRKRWRVEPDTTRVPKLQWDEAAAIYLGRKFLEPLVGTIFWEASQKAITKLKVTFTPQALDYIQRISSLLFQTSVGDSDYTTRAEFIDLLTIAWEEEQVAVINYQSLKSDAPRPCRVHPYGLVSHEGTLYLVAFAEEHQAIRTYKVDRISGVVATKERFERPPGFDLSQYLVMTLGVYSVDPDTPAQLVHVRFEGSAVRHLREHRFHVSQREVEERPDGSVVVAFELASLVELGSLVLSFGSKAEVLEPSHFRAEIARTLRATLGRYEGHTSPDGV